MTREQFMQSLEKLLAALPTEERRDALDYYDEYFDAAGPDREAETLAELGSPEEVAQKILEDQPTVPAAVDPNGTSRPAQAAAHRFSLNQTLRWAGLAVVVVILCMFLFQHSFARNVAQTGDVYTIASSDSAQTASTTEVSLEALKKLTLDLDTGSVIFEEKAGLTEASVAFKDPDPRASLSTDFSASGSTISYKLPRNTTGSESDTFTVIITLPTDFEMELLDVSLDMGSLTLGSLNVNDLEADLDMGSVIADFLTCNTADVELDMGSFTARQVDAKTLTAGSSMGSLSIGLLRAEKADLSTDMGSVTVTLTAPAENYALHASSDLGKLTIAGKTYHESYTSSGHYPVTLSTSMGQITVNYK